METISYRQSLGFVPCESGLLFVVDPTVLEPYLKDPSILDDWSVASVAAASEGTHEVALGTGGGHAVAVFVDSQRRGGHVLVKKELEGGGGITLDPNVRDAT